MSVIVDTSVWSLVLRRKPEQLSDRELQYTTLLNQLVYSRKAHLLEPIRQEVLSGIKQITQFEALKIQLRTLPTLALLTEDYERAAMYFNLCRSSGVQGSNTDLLICATSIGNNMAILTTDKDFQAYARLLPINLLSEM